MTSRTHKLFALTSLIAVSSYTMVEPINLTTLAVVLIANVIGSMLPDIDQASNRLWDLLPGGNFTGGILKKLLLSHRTLSHSILGVGLFYWLTSLLANKLLNPNYIDQRMVTNGLMIGYISHLIADGLTEEGLPLFFPIKWKFGFPPIKSWRIKTGKWFETYVIFPSVLLGLMIIVVKNLETLTRLLKF